MQYNKTGSEIVFLIKSGLNQVAQKRSSSVKLFFEEIQANILREIRSKECIDVRGIYRSVV